MANTTKNENNHRNDSKMCKTKPVLSEAWAELSPPQPKQRRRRNEEELGGGRGGGLDCSVLCDGSACEEIEHKAFCRIVPNSPSLGWGGWVQVRRGKNPRQGGAKRTVQLRTSKIHKTHRQAGGLSPYLHLIFAISSPYRHHICTIYSSYVRHIFIIYISCLHHFVAISSRDVHHIFIISSSDLHQIFTIFSYLHQMFFMSSPYLH